MALAGFGELYFNLIAALSFDAGSNESLKKQKSINFKQMHSKTMKATGVSILLVYRRHER